MNAKCYTFYSYKGGSGRTTTLLNTAKHMAELLNASKTNPILLVDADLESAGLTYFFNCENKFTARFNGTLHAEDFLNKPNAVLTGVVGDNTFGIQKGKLESCDAIANRISKLYSSLDVKTLFANVSLRTTTRIIFENIVSKFEKKKNNPQDLDENDNYICNTYDIFNLLIRLESVAADDANMILKKRNIIENFLPTDCMVDVSHYFGLEEGAIKFIGVDIAYTGRHASLNNVMAAKNKQIIAKECGKKGFKAVLFDCGAGVQSTAHVLNHVSDVLVYCMRPTYQFVSGTYVQLERYCEPLTDIVNIKCAKAEENGGICDKKSVILLPTAVPYNKNECSGLRDDSFKRIERIATSIFPSFIDATFCTYENSLKEVSLFKWREHILGTKPIVVEKLFEPLSESMLKAIEPYQTYETMPEDAKSAYKTYRLLAERLCYNS